MIDGLCESWRAYSWTSIWQQRDRELSRSLRNNGSPFLVRVACGHVFLSLRYDRLTALSLMRAGEEGEQHLPTGGGGRLLISSDDAEGAPPTILYWCQSIVTALR